MTSGRKAAWRWAAAVLLILCLAAWAVTHVDIAAVMVTLASADALKLFVVAPGLLLVQWAMRTARWMVILRAFGVAAPPLRTHLQIGAVLGLSAATPAQAGELFKLAYLKADHGIQIARGAGGFAAERFADVIVLAAFTLLSASVLVLGRQHLLPLAGLIVAAVLIGLLAVRVAPRLPLPAFIQQILSGYAEIARKPRLAILMFAATVVCWLLTAELWRVSLAAVGVDATMMLSLFLVGIVTLATVLSFVPGGAGISEVTVVVVLVQHGYSDEQSLAAAVILRFLTVLSMSLGLVHWLALKLKP